MSKVLKGAVALLGGLAIAVSVGMALNSAVASEKIVVDKNGVTVKLTNIVAETTKTGMMTSVNGGAMSEPSIHNMAALPKALETMIADSNASTTSIMKVDGTFCFVTFVSYQDKDAGRVDVPLGAECKSFPAGSMLGAVLSFAEDYTKEVTNTYKTKFQVLK